MQALLGSSRFCQLLLALKAAAGELDPSASPTLAALAQLAAEFPPLSAAEEAPAQPDAQQEAAGGEPEDGDGRPARANGGGGAAAPAGKSAAAAAAKAALLGGLPFHPHMLSDVVNAFRPHGSGTPAAAANIVLGPGGGKPNGGVSLAVSWVRAPGPGAGSAHAPAALQRLQLPAGRTAPRRC